MKELPQVNLRPEVLLENASRWRWLFIVPFCLAMIVGMTLSIILPKVYESSTTILIQPQKVPSDYVKPLVATDIEDRLRTIKQQILSWSNLEKIMATYKLYEKPEHSGMLMEEKIFDLRKQISIDVVRGGRGADAFSISFKGKDPQVVMNVTNALASYFINANLKTREEQAMGTSSFLQDELSTMRKQLLAMEEALKEYRRQNMGELPEQLQSNLSILSRLQEDLLEKQKALRESKTAVLLLEEQLRTLPQAQPEGGAASRVSPQGSVVPSQRESELASLKSQYENMRNHYTERHPDVVRLKRKLDDLEAAPIPDTEETSPDAAATGTAPRIPSATQIAKVRQRGQILQLRNEIYSQELEIEAVRKQIEIYTKRVENTPKREQELYSLNRDYGNLKEAYNSLLSRKLEADLSVNMEKKQKGEQFQILDAARLPEKPISPKVERLFAISVALGLGVGGAIVFLLAYFDQAVRRPEEIETSVGVSVLVSIPSILQPAELRRRHLHMAFSLCGVGFCALLCGAFGVLTVKGVDRTVDFVSRILS